MIAATSAIAPSTADGVMQRGEEIERKTIARRWSVQRQDAGRALLLLNQQR
jgi:hypothetical protein